MIAGPCSSCWRPIWLCACPRSGRRFPIQRGPDVPWEVMAPHASQCQRNHSQSLERLAERGGLEGSEAWAVVNGLDYFDMEKAIGWVEADRLWRQYAERVNLHYDEMERFRTALADRDARLAELRDVLNGWKVRLAFVGMPGEPRHADGTPNWGVIVARTDAALAETGAGKERSRG